MHIIAEIVVKPNPQTSCFNNNCGSTVTEWDASGGKHWLFNLLLFSLIIIILKHYNKNDNNSNNNN